MFVIEGGYYEDTPNPRFAVIVVWKTRWVSKHLITVYGDTEQEARALANQMVKLLNEYS